MPASSFAVLGSILGLQLVLSVGASFVGAWVALAMVFFSYGWWGLPIGCWLLINANTGWRALQSGVGTFGVRTNGEGALALAVFTNLLLALQLLWRKPDYSAWWGALCPVAYLLLTMILMGIYAFLLAFVNPEGKRAI